MPMHFEIITVLDDRNLIDEESYQRRYWTRDGRPLTPGHYVALWDEAADSYEFDGRATFVGPCRSSREAAMILQGCLFGSRPAPQAEAPEVADRTAGAG